MLMGPRGNPDGLWVSPASWICFGSQLLQGTFDIHLYFKNNFYNCMQLISNECTNYSIGDCTGK